MENKKYYSRTQSYHGSHASYQNSKSGKGYCYFNPLYDIDKIEEMPFRFLFKELAVQKFNSNISNPNKAEIIRNLRKLGELMVESNADQPSQNSTIPAGYTYFGQFLDHDITAGTGQIRPDQKKLEPFPIVNDVFDPIDPEQLETLLKNMRTPNFDLDSVYGGPGLAYLEFPEFYQKGDRIKLKIGKNSIAPAGITPDPSLDTNPSEPERDLPRHTLLTQQQIESKEALQGHPATTALIGDVRNDENLIVAQFHLAFLKFHNRLVDDLRSLFPKEDDESIFIKARGEFTRIYQWLVIHDFLKTLLGSDRVDEMLEQSKGVFGSKDLFTPFEFSTAAYRFGHSMVRNTYDFNLNFGREEGGNPALLERASFELLFRFTGKGTIDPSTGQVLDPGFVENKLPNNWIIQWQRFFERQPEFDDRVTRKIDTQLAEELSKMSNEAHEHLSESDQQQVPVSPIQFDAIMKHLAIRNLLRGYLHNMPCAQDILAEINKGYGTNLPVLSQEQIQTNNSEELNNHLSESGYLDCTPLWYYILKEAEVEENGNRLGSLGSWIVGNTMIGFIQLDNKISVINEEWGPKKSEIPELKSLSGIIDFLKYANVLISQPL